MSVNEKILDAISIIAKSYTEHLSFDQTVECEITAIDNIEEGTYRVLYNGNQLIAKALDKTIDYAIGDAVFMKINENDLSKERFIIAKRQGDTSDTLVNSIQPIGPVWQLIENSKNYQAQEIEFTKPEKELFLQFANNYDYIILSADFTTWFLEDKTGRYGLRIYFATSKKEVVLDNVLDSKNFVGKPFEFFEGSTQQILINYPKGTIKGINKIEFYCEDDLTLKEINESQEFVDLSNVTIQFCDYIDYTNDSYNLNINSIKGYAFNNETEEIELTAELIYKGYTKLPEEDIRFQWYQFKNGNWKKIINKTDTEAQWKKYQDKLVELDQAYIKKVKEINEIYKNDEKLRQEASNEALKEHLNERTKIEEEYAKNIKYENKNYIILNKQNIDFSGLYKLTAIYQDTVYLEEEVTIYNKTSDITRATLNKKIENKKTYLFVDCDKELEYIWKLVYPDGEEEVLEEKSSVLDITKYLGYEYLVVYAEGQLRPEGELNGRTQFVFEHILFNSTSESDINVYFEGESEYLYDENGDISFQQHEYNRTLKPNIVWAEGKVGYIKSVNWYVDGYAIDKLPSGSSMIEDCWMGENYTLNYQIAKKYNPAYPIVNLQLYVELLSGDVFKFDKEIKFTKLGNQGSVNSTYQLVIRPIDQEGIIIKGYTSSGNLKAFLYKNGEEIEAKSYQWNDDLKSTTPILIATPGNYNYKVKVLTPEGNYLYAYYGINKTLEKIDENLVDVGNLPKEIKYDENGLNPDYTNIELKAYYGDKQFTITGTEILLVENNILKPLDKYNSNNVFANLTLAIDDKKCIEWPVSMIINTAGKELIQGWDGNQLVADENNENSDIITTPQAGAGTVNEEGKFSGVVLGELTETADSTETKETQGLYGYFEGQKTFGLTANGDAYFGTNKEIQIDADNAIISGSGGEYRMTIDLSAETNTEEAISIEGSSNFKVKYDGSMEASAGTIGGWNITSEELHDKERVTVLSAINGITTDTLEIVDKTKKDKEEEYISLGELGKILGSTTNNGEAATTVCMGIDTRPTKEQPTRAISIVLESGENIRISVPEGKSLYVNCEAENQHGIYARFA